MLDGMSFFDDAPSTPSDLQHGGSWDRPFAQFPHVALTDTLLLARTNEVAVAVEAIWAFKSGFEFWLKMLFRAPAPAPDEQTNHQSLHIGLQFADGRRVANVSKVPDPVGSVAAGLLMKPVSFGGGQYYRSRSYWVWPLPPAGPLVFACEWPAFHIGEQQVTVDANLILDASDRSFQVWPDDSR